MYAMVERIQEVLKVLAVSGLLNRCSIEYELFNTD